MTATISAPSGPTTGLQGYNLDGAADAGKSTKVDAEYVPGPVGNEPCRECKMFVRPDACSAVSGPVSPEGHCKLFQRAREPRDRDQTRLHGQTGRLTGFDEGDDDLENVAKSVPVRCAGVALVLPDGRALFLRRGHDQDHAGEWAFPGGHEETGESAAEAARRECYEETGIYPDPSIISAVRVLNDNFEYETFVCRIAEQDVHLSTESTEYVWTDTSHPPTPLHPWVAAVIPVVASTSGATASTMTGKVAKSRDGQSDGDDKMNDAMMRLFVPIQKIDVAQRLVYGTAASEMPDHAGEVFDYDSSKPLFRAWSDGFSKTTGGRSLGNVRSMHNPKIAAGKVTSIDFNDAGKTVNVAIKVVDDDEWRKVDEGVYTGISIGGKYAKRWRDGDHMRYTAQPAEVSLVDNPCIPDALFSAIKADGSEELRKFKGGEMKIEITNDLVAARAAKLAKAAGDALNWTDYLVEARTFLEKEAKEAVDSTKPRGGDKTPTHHGRQGLNGDEGDTNTIEDDATDDDPGKTKPPRTKGDQDSKNPVPVTDKTKDANADGSVSHKAACAGDDDGDWGQVWVSKRLPGQTFARKSDLRAALTAHDAAELVAKRAAPVMDALRSVTALLDDREGVSVTVSAIDVLKADDATSEAVRCKLGCVEKDWTIARAAVAARTDLGKILAGVPAILVAKADGVVTVDGATATAIKKFVADVVEKREYSEDERKKYAKSGIAKPDGSYPIPDKAALKDAKEAYGRSPTMGTKRHINRRAKELGEPGLGETKSAGKASGDDLGKAVTLQSVSSLMSLLGMLECCEEEFEIAPGKPTNMGFSGYAGTMVAVPKDLTDRFGSVVVDLGDIVSEVLDMLMSSIRGDERREAMVPAALMEQAVAVTDLAKALMLKVGAKHSAADKAKIKSAHDMLADLDSDCCPGSGDADKALIVTDLEKKLVANDAAFGKALDGITAAIGDMSARVKRIEATPLPGPHPAMFRLVEKGAAGGFASAPFATGPESAYEMVPGVGRVRVTAGAEGGGR